MVDATLTLVYTLAPMSKKESTMPIPVRLPLSIIKAIDAKIADQYGVTRSGWIAKLVVDNVTASKKPKER